MPVIRSVEARSIVSLPLTSWQTIRIFELYSRGNMTLELMAERLAAEGHVYQPSQPRFQRTGLSYILNNRFYIGEIVWREETYLGKHRPLIDRATFQLCQDILHGKNRRTGKPEIPLSGGLFTCAHCGSAITGERIRRRLNGGGVNEHIYYRCANNHPSPHHPRVRWRAADLEQAIVDDLASLRLPSREIADWFRMTLRAAFADIATTQHRQRQALTKRQTELAHMKDRLLTAYLSGSIGEGTFQSKSTDLGGQLREVEMSLQRCGDIGGPCRDILPARGDIALTVFDWSQKAVETWQRSKIAEKRAILEAVSLNRALSDVSLCVEKRKPFSFLAERPSIQLDRGDCRSFEPALRGWIDEFSQPTPHLSVLPGLTLQCA